MTPDITRAQVAKVAAVVPLLAYLGDRASLWLSLMALITLIGYFQAAIAYDYR